MSYLTNLTLRLAAGVAQLPDEFRRRHAAYLAAAQNDDGGFAGRQGPSDLYYTSLALRGLTLLGELDDRTAARAGVLLNETRRGTLSGVEFFSLVQSDVLLAANGQAEVVAASGQDRAETVSATIEGYRREDGGYAKNAASPASSTYHTFLAVMCKQLVGATLVRPDETIEMIHSRRRDDGGFVEIPQMRAAGTNPTAAAVAVLAMLDAEDHLTRQAAARFLSGMQTAEGGFRANTQIPVADLLSTFTALIALDQLDALDLVDVPAAANYAESLQMSDGGFRGGLWDDTADVEYTFYGLGVGAFGCGMRLAVGSRQ